MTDALAQLSEAGVSVWLDDLSRELLNDGSLQRLIDEKHVVGVTTNPTIFASALAKGDAYDEQLRAARRRRQGRGDRPVRDHHGRRPQRLRRDASRLRPDRRSGRPGVHRGRPWTRPRHRSDRRHGQEAVGDRGPAQRVDQDPGDRRGAAGDLADHCGRDQRQRHADLRPGPLPRRHAGLPDRARAGPRGRPRPVHDPLGRLVLRLPGGHRGRPAAGRDRLRRGEGAARQGGGGQRPAGLPGVRGGLLALRAGRCSPRTAPTRSARCGRPPA